MGVAAVDWSGDATPAGQREHIWIALVEQGALVDLVNGLTRAEIVRYLANLAAEDPDLVVGLDFAFGLPAWFARDHGCLSVAELWALVASEGEQWLRTCQTPFWGRPGTTRPELPAHLRRTDLACEPVAGIRPKSVFQIGGAGAVGTGSLRGMPYLRELQEDGFAVWPFDHSRRPTIVEIYPRILTGPVRKSDGAERRRYLAGLCLPAGLANVAERSEDAFDAAVSALVMARHADELRGLEPSDDPVTRLEGAIWIPPAAVLEPEGE